MIGHATALATVIASSIARNSAVQYGQNAIVPHATTGAATNEIDGLIPRDGAVYYGERAAVAIEHTAAG
jgi:hypothetical protein